MTYQPDQFLNIVPHVPVVPKWLILGGPADGNEAQCAIKIWPEIKIIGIEPVNDFILWQLSHEWPVNHPIIPRVLSDRNGAEKVYPNTGNLRASSINPSDSGKYEGIFIEMKSSTIDSLSIEFGPFEYALIWLDIEGAEYKALLGAEKLFRRNGVVAVNVEITNSRPNHTIQLEDLFGKLNFQEANRWNDQGTHHDRLYIPRK